MNRMSNEPSSDHQKALDNAVAQIHKQFGPGAIMRLGERPEQSIQAIPTGSLSLDLALGVGGVPRGRIVEIFGGESSGKTTLALHILAEAQKMGGGGVIIDAEHALDPTYAANLGVDVDQLLISQPECAEEALEIADVLVRSGSVAAVVVDSVAGLVPRSELEGEMGDAAVGIQARLMSQALRKLAGNLHKSNTVAVFVNQIREKIGVMFGSPEVTPGGRALKFWASVRMKVRRLESLKQGGEIIGSRTAVQVVKNKVAPPFREATFDILFGKGISRAGDILDLATANGLIKKTGTWFSYGELRLGQGRENARQFLEDNPEVMAELENILRQSCLAGRVAPVSQAVEPEGE